MTFNRDTAFGVLGVVLAGIYWLAAEDIQRSFLADEVGADGVPKMLAMALAVLGAVTVVRSITAKKIALDDKEAGGKGQHLRAFGLLMICLLYLALMPVLGYFAATAALIAGSAVYAGEGFGRNIVLTAIAGSVALWLIFAKLFAISLPAGVWVRMAGI
jgi:putative tricarboxylic transport membrane protein